MSNVDRATLEVMLARKRKLREEQNAEKIDSTPVVTEADTYLKQSVTPVKQDSTDEIDTRALFSKIFWKPISMPDFLIPSYSPDHWASEIRSKIPTIDKTYFLDKKTIEKIMFSIREGDTTLLHGQTGTGKTTIAEQIAAHCGIPFFRVSCHGQMEASEFLGGNSVVNENGVPITQHSSTDTTTAATYGGMLCIDEVFRSPAESLMTLQSLFEIPHKLSLQDSHGIDRDIKIPENDFFLVLTDNTTGTGDSQGNFVSEVQDTSTRNRIRRCVYVGYMSAKDELALLQKSYPDTPASIHISMIKVANLMRNAFDENIIMDTMSIRELLTWSKDLKDLRNIEQAFHFGVFGKLGKDDMVQVTDMYRQVFATDVTEGDTTDE
jgi:cobaltochelatase CobS